MSAILSWSVRSIRSSCHSRLLQLPPYPPPPPPLTCVPRFVSPRCTHLQLQKSAKMYQMECQAKQAKQGKQAKKVNSPNKFKAKKGGGHAEGGFETAKQARSEKDECEAMLRVRNPLS